MTLAAAHWFMIEEASCGESNNLVCLSEFALSVGDGEIFDIMDFDMLDVCHIISIDSIGWPIILALSSRIEAAW